MKSLIAGAIADRQRFFSHAAAVLSISTIAVTAACGAHTPPPAAPAPGASSTAAAPATTATAAPVNAGIVVQNYTANGISADGLTTVGYVDPTTGQYSQIAQYRIGTPQGSPAEQAVLYSPDLLRYASTRGDGHAGWTDSNGVFTDVTADAPTQVPFGAEARVYRAVGFDAAGNYFYTDDAGAVYELASGQTSGAKQVHLDSGVFGARFIRDGSGELTLQYSTALADNIGGWLSPDEYVAIEDIDYPQICKAPIDQLDDSPGNDTACQSGTTLLPATSHESIGNPVVSPDKRHVAFKRLAEDNSVQLWMVDTTGHGQPTQMPLKGSEVGADTILLGWK